MRRKKLCECKCGCRDEAEIHDASVDLCPTCAEYVVTDDGDVLCPHMDDIPGRYVIAHIARGDGTIVDIIASSARDAAEATRTLRRDPAMFSRLGGLTDDECRCDAGIDAE